MVQVTLVMSQHMNNVSGANMLTKGEGKKEIKTGKQFSSALVKGKEK